MLRRLFTTSKGPRDLQLVALLGGFDVEVVGEASYQEALERLCGGRTDEGADLECVATLRAEPSNPYDPDAIRVEIDGEHVGYLNRHAAKAFRPVADRLARQGQVGTCRARIVGGWDREDDRGHFGVRLDLGVN